LREGSLPCTTHRGKSSGLKEIHQLAAGSEAISLSSSLFLLGFFVVLFFACRKYETALNTNTCAIPQQTQRAPAQSRGAQQMELGGLKPSRCHHPAALQP